MDLLAHLSKLPDSRRKQGLRYPLDKTMVLMLIGSMAGCEGYRCVARFCKRYEGYLSKILELKHGVPSHVSLTSIVDSIDLEAFEKALKDWGVSKMGIGNKAPGVVAIDGKAIKSSLKNGTSRQQNFISVVHAFCVSQELVIGSVCYENKHQNEGEMVRQMIEMLGIKGALYTLDANHDSKKR